MKDTWENYVGIKFGVGRTDDFDPDDYSDKIKFVDDITKMRKKSENPKEFYDILITYLKDRPVIVKSMEKSVNTLASEITGLSILKIIANEEPIFMRRMLEEPKIIVEFGKAIKKMIKNNAFNGQDIKIAVGLGGEIIVGDEVDALEKRLRDDDNYMHKSSSHMYEKYIEEEGAPDVSLRDIDSHLEGQA